MSKIKVSAVSYLNSTPFIYGLEHSEIIHEIDLSLDIPAICAQKTISGVVDIGLVPVAVLPQIRNAHILGDFCIGAEGKVGSVMLYSQVPLEEIKEVMMDYQSRTSVMLARILAKHYWKIAPAWIPAEKDFEAGISAGRAAVIIGDRTFSLAGKYSYSYDLAEEWQRFCGLPFVFACWVANKSLPGTFIEKFNKAIQMGVENRLLVIGELEAKKRPDIDIAEYLNKSISYSFDAPKKQALELFLSYLPDIG